MPYRRGLGSQLTAMRRRGSLSPGSSYGQSMTQDPRLRRMPAAQQRAYRQRAPQPQQQQLPRPPTPGTWGMTAKGEGRPHTETTTQRQARQARDRANLAASRAPGQVRGETYYGLRSQRRNLAHHRRPRYQGPTQRWAGYQIPIGPTAQSRIAQYRR